PLRGTKGGSDAAAGIANWVGAGFPASKILLGLAAYGHSATASVDMSRNSKDMYQAKVDAVPRGDSADAEWADTTCDPNATKGVLSGVWRWKKLLAEGPLKDAATAGYGWTRYWDDASKTPWLWRAADKTFISYDDPESIGHKVQYAQDSKLGGLMVWDL
ncbi:glycoside hydrolase, partial [Ramicandelaber brevisporus]